MEQGPRWQPTRLELIGLTSAVVGLLVIAGYSAEWTGFPDKTLWNWLQLLIVPLVMPAGGMWFNRQQREREMEIADQQRERELEIENQRAQDEALQAYLDGMEKLLLDNNLRTSPENSEARISARSRTLTVLPRLDGSRKTRVLQSLYESGLIERSEARVDTESKSISRREPVVNLRGANLNGAKRWTVEQLTASFSLKGATMPNGQKYEEWLKDIEGRGEDGEDRG